MWHCLRGALQIWDWMSFGCQTQAVRLDICTGHQKILNTKNPEPFGDYAELLCAELLMVLIQVIHTTVGGRVG